MTKLEIIEELFDNGYCKAPSARSVTGDGFCEYQTSDGRMCAAGKCLESPEIEMGPCDDIVYLESKLKQSFKGHEIGFWRDLQELHDGENYWHTDETSQAGMSDEGKNRLTKLKEKYK